MIKVLEMKRFENGLEKEWLLWISVGDKVEEGKMVDRYHMKL